jgi:hypothetical protein
MLVAGVPGPRGPQGISPGSPLFNIVYTIPVDPPVDDAQRTVFYFNAAPPNVATVARAYTWNDVSWDGGPNFAGPGGVKAYSGTSDPNTTPPSGANIGDLYFRTAGPIYTMYQMSTISTGGIIWGPINTFGLSTNNIAHTSGPGPVTVDVAYFSTLITADKAINLGGLNPDDTNYTDQGVWTVQVFNDDASSITFELGLGVWEQNPDITIPSTITAGGSLFLTFVRNMVSGKYVIVAAFESIIATS